MSQRKRYRFLHVNSVPLGFRREVIRVFFLILTAADLYSSFQGLVAVARLQYSFQEAIYYLLTVAA